MQPLAKNMGGLDHGIKLDTLIVRIENPVQLTPACMHRFGHLVFTELLMLHGLCNVLSQDTLDGNGFGFTCHAFALQEVIKR